MDVDITHGFFAWKPRIWFIIELSAGDDMRLAPGRGQMEGEVTENLTGGGMVGEEKAIEEDDALHLSATSRAGRRNQALRSSRYHVVARHLHRDCSAHDLEQDANATGIVEAIQDTEQFGGRTPHETNFCAVFPLV